MTLTFRELKQRPEGWERRPDRSTPFKAGYGDTMVLLDRELAKLGATEPILQVDVLPGQVRVDGQLRAGVKVRYPGVILSFETKRFGTLSYPCNAFDEWTANLRAIALGLEALRKVERYGIAERGQQYAGWAELPSGIALGAAPMTREEAAAILREGAAWIGDFDPNDRNELKAAYRIASMTHHPDHGGELGVFDKITEAYDLLAA